MEEGKTKAAGQLHYVLTEVRMLWRSCRSRTQGSRLEGTWLPESVGSLTARVISTKAFYPDSEDPETSAVLETGTCEALSEDV